VITESISSGKKPNQHPAVNRHYRNEIKTQASGIEIRRLFSDATQAFFPSETRNALQAERIGISYFLLQISIELSGVEQ
jgi:hypothetical protein